MAGKARRRSRLNDRTTDPSPSLSTALTGSCQASRRETRCSFMLAKSEAPAIDAEAIRRAAELIRPHVRRTPVIEVSPADFGLKARKLVFKLELLQHAGSFKPRGAFTNLLTRFVPPAGVAAASGGNHGAAVAYAAQQLGKSATIFVPGLSAEAKRDRIRSYGADLVVGGEIYDEALAACDAYVTRTGAMAVH